MQQQRALARRRGALEWRATDADDPSATPERKLCVEATFLDLQSKLVQESELNSSEPFVCELLEWPAAKERQRLSKDDSRTFGIAAVEKVASAIDERRGPIPVELALTHDERIAPADRLEPLGPEALFAAARLGSGAP